MADVIEIVQGTAVTVEVAGPAGPQGPPGASQADVLTTQGDLLYRGASAAARLGIGTAGQILKVNAGATAPEWGAPPASGVTSVAGRTGDVTLAKADVGLGNVDNTSDANKPISTATQTALDGKAASSHTHTANQITDFDSAAQTATALQYDGGYPYAAGLWDYSQNLIGSDVQDKRLRIYNGAFSTAAIDASGVSGYKEFDLPNASGTLALTTTPPASHTHGSITNDGKIGTTANLPLITTTEGAVATGSFGTSANTFCQGNDSRLSDARTPTAHTHAAADVTSGTFDNARVNFAAPANIGTTTPAQGFFTNLTASAELQLPTNAPASPSAGDLYRVTDTLRYRDSSNTERLLLNAADNLSNLANTATARTNLGLGSSSAVTFGSLTANNGTLTASAPVLDLAQTWNNSAVAFTGFRANFTNTASSTSTKAVDFQVGGSSIFESNWRGVTTITKIGATDTTNAFVVRSGTTPANMFTVRDDGLVSANLAFQVGTNVSVNTTSGIKLRSDFIVEWSSTSSTGGSSDLVLRRDAANTLAQYNGTNAQRYNLYGTYTSSTNFERLFLEYNSTATAFRIGTEKGSGGGSARPLALQTDGTTRLTIGSSGGFTLADAQDIAVGTTTGTKIGTATTQKIGFFNATPVVQQAAVADSTDTTNVATQLNSLLARLRTLGLIGT